MRHHRKFQWSLWGAPSGFALVSAVGLLSALLGDGFWDAVSWLGLGLPVAACLWFGWVRRGRIPP